MGLGSQNLLSNIEIHLSAPVGHADVAVSLAGPHASVSGNLSARDDGWRTSHRQRSDDETGACPSSPAARSCQSGLHAAAANGHDGHAASLRSFARASAR